MEAARHPVDDHVGRQRRLRAFLEPALADVSVRRLHKDELQLHCQCDAVCGQFAPGATGWTPAAGVAVSSCNNNWNYWNVGTRTQWNIDSQTYIGVDIVYQPADGEQRDCCDHSNNGTQPSALRTFSDQSAFIGQFRVHRNFYP